MTDAEPSVHSVFELLERAATSASGIRFITGDGDTRSSYRQLLERALCLAPELDARVGVHRTVLLVLKNGADVVELLFAALATGCVPAILPPLRPFGDLTSYAAGLARTAKLAGDALVVTSPALARALRDLPTFDAGRVVATDELKLHERSVSAPTRDDELALLQLTSGSLADPKGVELTHTAVLADALAIRDRLGATHEDCGCFWVPLAHDMALVGLFMHIAAKSELVVMSTDRFAADPARWLELTAAHATITTGPPFAYEIAAKRLIRRGTKVDLSRVRAAIVGAEPISARLLRNVHATLGPLGLREPVFVPAYGLAEDTCVAALGIPGDAFPTRRVQAPLVPFAEARPAPDDAAGLELVGHGPLLDGQRARVVDGNGGALPDGWVGLIELSGAALMRGYYADPDASATALDGGWLRTFDYGFMEGGFLYIAGRAKDLIVVRGRNVLPEEIEAVALETEGAHARGVVAFGVVDPAGEGERVTLVVEVPRSDSDDQREALRTELVRQIADSLDVLVHRVVFVKPGEILRTTSGKPRRGACRELWGSP